MKILIIALLMTFPTAQSLDPIDKLYNELKGELPVNAEGGKVMNVQPDFLDFAIKNGVVKERNGRYYTDDGIEMKSVTPESN